MYSRGEYLLTSEAQLRAMMVAGLEGDPEAHEFLLTALVPLLRSFFRRRIRGAQDDAEDLVQETLLAVHARRATYDRNRAFTVWLYAIARYKLVDHFRRHRHQCPIEELSEMLVIEGFEDASAAVLDVERLLKDLPTKQAG